MMIGLLAIEELLKMAAELRHTELKVILTYATIIHCSCNNDYV